MAKREVREARPKPEVLCGKNGKPLVCLTCKMNGKPDNHFYRTCPEWLKTKEAKEAKAKAKPTPKASTSEEQEPKAKPKPQPKAPANQQAS